MLDKQLGARGISKLDPGKEKEYMDALQQQEARGSADRNRKIAFLCPNRTVADRIAEPLAMLRRAGYDVDLIRTAPYPIKFQKIIDSAKQIWVLGDSFTYLSNYHREGIRKFYERGGGLFIMGACRPNYADANRITKELVGTTMNGDILCDKFIGVQEKPGMPGIVRDHPIAKGVESLYEGYRIAAVTTDEKTVKPLVYTSTGDVVTAYVDDGKHRMLIDGVYGHMNYQWDEAGSGRFLLNCAAWLEYSL